MNKKISIITVALNCSDIIEKTIKSVVEFVSNEVEYIIIDGGSTDRTTEIINNYNDKITYWISEKDNGIYNAMNKGIKKSLGKYIYFINAGDILVNLPIDTIFSSEEDIISFPVKLSNNKTFFPVVGKKLKYTNTLHHQGSFYKNNETFQFDISYKVFSDFNTNQNILKNKKNIRTLNNPIIAFHDLGGISNNPSSFNEIYSIILKNFGFYYVIKSWIYYKYKGLLQYTK